MFWKYMSDLCDNLSKEFCVVTSDDILAHILSGDDLILLLKGFRGNWVAFIENWIFGMPKVLLHNYFSLVVSRPNSVYYQ